MLLALAAIWGSSFLFIKVAVREVTPGEVVFGRVLTGTLALIPAVPFLLGWRQTWSGLRQYAGPLLLLGGLAILGARVQRRRADQRLLERT